MIEGRKIILEYQSVGGVNRNIFLLNHGYAFHAFGALHDQSNLLGAMLQTGRDAQGNTYVSFLSFLLLIQRQALSAFQMLWSHQSYQAWVLLRPAIESALIMGKWLDDPTNAKIWKARATDRKRYAKTYTGTALRSKSLPRSEDLQKVLSRINDDFMHLNPAYFSRHSKVSDVDKGNVALLLHYFDDESDHQVHLLAFLHLVATLQDSLAEMLGARLINVSPPSPLVGELEGEMRDRVRKLVEEHPDRSPVLLQLGLWSPPSL